MNKQRKPGKEFVAFAHVILPVGAGLILLTVTAVGWFTQPDRFARGYAPGQPIAYSHRLHAGVLKIPCLYCHTNARRSRHAGVPAVETCMNCHRVTKTDSPEIKKLTAIFESNQPLKWRRIHSLPDHVYFDHRPHVNGGIECQTCHGEIQSMDIVSQYMSMRMGNCLGCHRDAHDALPPDSRVKEGPEYCNACHR
jgi:hypothetical protein